MGGRNWWVLGRLKRVVKKINLLLSFNLRRWRLANYSILPCNRASTRRGAFSFNDRLGLHGCIAEQAVDESSSDDQNKLIRTFQRTTSYAPINDNSSAEDVDKRAEIFIANFHRQLLLERQVSLQLRYGLRE